LAESGWSPALTNEQKAELDRRTEDLLARPESAVTWEQIVNHVKRQR
jgi:putative addiction module component (TIGR02574 family)